MLWICGLYHENPEKCFVSKKIPNETPNPYYGCTPSGCLSLVEYYGYPSIVGTPLGGWSLCHQVINVHPNILEVSAVIQDRLGLVPVFFQHSDDPLHPRGVYHDGICGGEYGPLWLITKDLQGNSLPAFPENAFCGASGTTVGFPMNLPYKEAKELFEKVKPANFRDWKETLE